MGAGHSGDAAHGPSSASLLQHVTGLPTATVVTSSPTPSVAGQAVTLEATVTGPSATPTGTVTCYDGGVELGSAALTTNGVAALLTDALPPEVRHITASYGGDDTHAASFATIDHAVTKVVTTTVLPTSTNPSIVGGAVVYTAS